MSIKRTRDLVYTVGVHTQHVGRKQKANKSDRDVTEEVRDQEKEVAPKLQKWRVSTKCG